MGRKGGAKMDKSAVDISVVQMKKGMKGKKKKSDEEPSRENGKASVTLTTGTPWHGCAHHGDCHLPLGFRCGLCQGLDKHPETGRLRGMWSGVCVSAGIKRRVGLPHF